MHARIALFGALGRVAASVSSAFGQRSVFGSRNYIALVSSYGLRQEFITPYALQHNDIREKADDANITKIAYTTCN